MISGSVERNDENFRRVALLVASLDRDTADQLLDQFPEARAQAVRDAVLALSHVDLTEQAAVIRDFLGADGQSYSLASSTGSATHGSPSHDGPATQVAKADRQTSAAAKPLERASERLIAECLCDEMPQAIAVALAQLPTRRASEVVAHLPASLQTHVLERLVELDPASSLDSPDIRDEFYQWLNEQIERSLHRAELAQRLATILDATHSGTRQRILHNVSSSDARLAKELHHQLAARSIEKETES